MRRDCLLLLFEAGSRDLWSSLRVQEYDVESEYGVQEPREGFLLSAPTLTARMAQWETRSRQDLRPLYVVRVKCLCRPRHVPYSVSRTCRRDGAYPTSGGGW